MSDTEARGDWLGTVGLVSAVIDDYIAGRIPPGALLCYNVLCRRRRSHGVLCRIGDRELAKIAHVKRDSIAAYIDALVQTGHVHIVTRAVGRRSVYLLPLPSKVATVEGPLSPEPSKIADDMRKWPPYGDHIGPPRGTTLQDELYSDTSFQGVGRLPNGRSARKGTLPQPSPNAGRGQTQKGRRASGTPSNRRRPAAGDDASRDRPAGKDKPASPGASPPLPSGTVTARPGYAGGAELEDPAATRIEMPVQLGEALERVRAKIDGSRVRRQTAATSETGEP